MSCENESSVDQNILAITKEDINEKDINLLVKNVAKLTNDKDFKNLVYNEINKRFDGDNNSLLNTLSKSYKANSLRSANLLRDYEIIISSLNSKGLFPQIYIPYYENTKLRSSGNNNSVIYVIDALNSPDSVTLFPAIYVDENGDIRDAPFLIDENFAQKNEVWVISYNERVDKEGNMINNIDLRSARIGTKSEYLMKIKCPNLRRIEGWVKGAPELRCIMKSAKGEISDQYFYPPTRASIKNKWWEINGVNGRYLYYWNIESYTKTVLFSWIEVDNAGATHEFSGSFTYKDVNKDTNQEYTGTAGYKYTYKAWDKLCGSISVHFDDGRLGEAYSTGLIDFLDAYK